MSVARNGGVSWNVGQHYVIVAWSCISVHCRRREVILLFFNKTEDDILWRDQLDRLGTAVDW